MHLLISELIALRRFILFSTLFFATAITSFSQTAVKIDPIKGMYFGQTLPGESPVLFAPEVLKSVSAWVEATAFSPDGSLFFLAVGDSSYSSAKLYYSRCVNNVWTTFSEPPFLSGFTFSHSIACYRQVELCHLPFSVNCSSFGRSVLTSIPHVWR